MRENRVDCLLIVLVSRLSWVFEDVLSSHFWLSKHIAREDIAGCFIWLAILLIVLVAY